MRGQALDWFKQHGSPSDKSLITPFLQDEDSEVRQQALGWFVAKQLTFTLDQFQKYGYLQIDDCFEALTLQAKEAGRFHPKGLYAEGLNPKESPVIINNNGPFVHVQNNNGTLT